MLESGYDSAGSFPKLLKLDQKKTISLRRQIIKELSLKGVELSEGPNGISSIRMRYFIPVTALTHQEFVRGYTGLWHGQLVIANDIGLALGE
jgi:hypothetical protein